MNPDDAKVGGDPRTSRKWIIAKFVMVIVFGSLVYAFVSKAEPAITLAKTVFTIGMAFLAAYCGFNVWQKKVDGRRE